MKNTKQINTANLLYNLKICKKKFNNLCVMVKANAYGHNARIIVNSLKDEINNFGVATAKEAVTLRKIFKSIDIFVSSKTNDYTLLIKHNISFCIDSIDELKIINKIATKLNKCALVHIKVNTGMNRLGVRHIDEFLAIMEFIKHSKFIKLVGVYTHTFDSDNKNTHFYQQMEIFYKFVKLIDDKSILIHIGGSYVLNHKIPKFVNMVRVGLFIYGYGKSGLKPVMSIRSRIAKIFKCYAGDYVGYGNSTQLKKDALIAVIPIGYADGVMRRLSNNHQLTINNQKCNIVGNICMDMLMVDVTNIKCKVGDVVIVMNNAQNIAKKLNTSVYEVLTTFNLIR